ncbi:TorF family putative porin [Paraglaciecola sp. L3A3]|uniref:TorF family putative porin n=1 Tax=Paraglaciecola sp. L3A3 TaxID=2686358 RepID=UPI00131AF02B|nr:TorF family putative porin [Paraglaciecola sp. L3A3]
MKLLKITSIAAVVLAATSFSQVASAEVTANVSVTNNYLWRGMEQTGGAAAVSGGIDYASDSGFYAGTWASNASWGDMKTELDVYFGFGGDISENVSYDVGYVYFAYPDSVANENDFSEIYASISASGFTFGLAVLADSEAGGDGGEFGDSIYANLDYGIALDSGAEIGLHIGDYSGDFSSDSTDIGVSISKDSFTFGVSKTDLDDGADSDDLKFYVSYAVDFTL